MNSTLGSQTFVTTVAHCSLTARVYSRTYLIAKYIFSTYLRFLVGPGILFNGLCLFVLSRPKLSNKSTTIVFLRFLAIFDILAVLMKYIRAELNYQSIENHRQIFPIDEVSCKTIYILMNAFISMAMWTIVLMSLDKAVAVSFPLKSNIWLSQRRVFYICCTTSIVLFVANLSFIKISGVLESRKGQKYCGLVKDSLIIDLLTASILPIALITGTNLVIALVLKRASKNSMMWASIGTTKSINDEEPAARSQRTISHQADRGQMMRRRHGTQVTRMLLAVTLSLIIFNIPNTLIFLLSKIYDARQVLNNRACLEVTNNDIRLYKIAFYSGVVQDILSDLPHVVNFFLYCLTGQKFRGIFINAIKNIFRQKKNERLESLRAQQLRKTVLSGTRNRSTHEKNQIPLIER